MGSISYVAIFSFKAKTSWKKIHNHKLNGPIKACGEMVRASPLTLWRSPPKCKLIKKTVEKVIHSKFCSCHSKFVSKPNNENKLGLTSIHLWFQLLKDHFKHTLHNLCHLQQYVNQNHEASELVLFAMAESIDIKTWLSFFLIVSEEDSLRNFFCQPLVFPYAPVSQTNLKSCWSPTAVKTLFFSDSSP